MLLDILHSLAEYRIAERYRADHDYSQALIHFCRSHDRLENLRGDADPDTATIHSCLPNSRWRVALLLSKGQAFYEQGQMKRACKWFLRAWNALDEVVVMSDKGHISTRRGAAHVDSAIAWLTEIRHEPEFNKRLFVENLRESVLHLDAKRGPMSLRVFAADILDRLGHTLMVLRLPPPDGDRLAAHCLELALELDPWNLLVRSDLLQLSARGRHVELDPKLPEPLASTYTRPRRGGHRPEVQNSA